MTRATNREGRLADLPSPMERGFSNLDPSIGRAALSTPGMTTYGVA
jgi:hypothetical protein